MNAVRIVAEVEGDTLVIPNMAQFNGRRVELIIVPFEEDREEMLSQSLEGLSRAYGDSEPEYSEKDLRERNPRYENR